MDMLRETEYVLRARLDVVQTAFYIAFRCALLFSTGRGAGPYDRCLLCPLRAATKPDQPFIPPVPYPFKPSAGMFWFGSDRPWTALPVTGTMGRIAALYTWRPDLQTEARFLATWLGSAP